RRGRPSHAARRDTIPRASAANKQCARPAEDVLPVRCPWPGPLVIEMTAGGYRLSLGRAVTQITLAAKKKRAPEEARLVARIRRHACAVGSTCAGAGLFRRGLGGGCQTRRAPAGRRNPD